MLAKWPIRNKLLIGLALLLVIVATLSWSGFHGLYAYRGLVKSVGRRAAELPLAADFSQRVTDLRLAMWQSRAQSKWTSPADGSAPASHQLAREEVRLHLTAVEDALKQYRLQLDDSAHQTTRFGDGSREWRTVAEIDDVLRHIAADNRDEDWMFDEVRFDRLEARLDQLQVLAAKLPSYLHQDIHDVAAEVRGQYRTLIVLTWITSLSAGLTFVLFIRLFYQWVFRPLRVLIKGSRKMAAGQFGYRIRLDADDEMAELAQALNDMTARFQAIRDDLDRQVQVRTKQVVRSEQLASVGFLAAGVAHEINNPLASIAMCAESLERRVRDVQVENPAERDVVVRYLAMIQNEAFRCKEITEKLLDFSRMGDQQRQTTDLGELVQGVIDMVAHLGRRQTHHIDFQPAGVVSAWVNPQEMKQVVLNLLTNALDSLADGGTVHVTLAERDGQAELRLTDDGCGMTPEVLEHLFEPFFTRRRGGQGTGLGLSITYRIIQDHGGCIDAESEGPDRGSRFTVCVPLAPANLTEKENHDRHQAA